MAAPEKTTTGRKRTGLRRALVEKEILDRAAELFAERGYKGTSLQDVADALGMSRTALYYYMDSKEAILGRLVENLSARDAKALEALNRRRTLSPPEKLLAMAHEIALNASSNPDQTRILTENRHHLPPDLAETDRAAERSIVKNLVAVIDAGVTSGEFRPVQPRQAALAVIGMCVWTAWWVQPGDTRTEELAAQIAEQALASVRAAETAGDRSEPGALLRNLRDNLDQLERVLKS